MLSTASVTKKWTIVPVQISAEDTCVTDASRYSPHANDPASSSNPNSPTETRTVSGSALKAVQNANSAGGVNTAPIEAKKNQLTDEGLEPSGWMETLKTTTASAKSTATTTRRVLTAANF